MYTLIAEDAALDFTDGTPAEAATVAADFGQKSLIDVEEDISYDDEEEEEVRAQELQLMGIRSGGCS